MEWLKHHFSLDYIKHNALMFGLIVVVFGVIFWLLLNKNSSSAATDQGYSPSAVGISTGPSDAAVAAQASVAATQAQVSGQVSLAQIQAAMQSEQDQASLAAATLTASNDAAANNLAAQVALAQNATTQNVNLAQISAASQASTDTLAAQTAQFGAQLAASQQISHDTNQATIDMATIAEQGAVATTQINATLQTNLGAQQAEAYKSGTLASLFASIYGATKSKSNRAILASQFSQVAGVAGGINVQPTGSAISQVFAFNPDMPTIQPVTM